MIKDLMGYVMNCSYGCERRGRDKSKIQQRATVLVNTLQCWLFLFSLLSTHVVLKLQLEAKKVRETSGFMPEVMPKKQKQKKIL